MKFPASRLFTALAVLGVFAAASVAHAAPGVAKTPPNIVLIMCDDAGHADFGFTGGVATTPVLDRLRGEGMLFTRAYNNARCMPTRATLLSGVNPERSYGDGFSSDVMTIPEALRPAGYRSYMVGKWHLGTPRSEADTTTPTPIRRGFDRFYGIWEGASQPTKALLLEAVARKDKSRKSFAPNIILDDRPLPWTEVPDDYYNTTTWTDKAVEFMKSTPADRPFFLYAAYTAPHWPLKPPASSIAPYKGKFDEGWDVLRARIVARQKELGIIPPDYPMPPREYGVPAWNEAPREMKEKFISGCETYYATITELDTQIGRLLQTLRDLGRADNTLVIFLSDNGADDVIGGRPRGNMSNLPYMGYKLTYLEGGPSTPFVVHWPGVVPAGTLSSGQQIFIEDVMSTALDLAGVSCPAERGGRALFAPEGRSFAAAMRDPRHAEPDRVHAWSHDGQRGIVAGEWKAVMFEKRHPASGKSYYDETKDGWYLYHLDKNRLETDDLAAAQPEKLKELIGLWTDWAKRNQWQPSIRFGLHPTDAANGIQSFAPPGAKRHAPVGE